MKSYEDFIYIYKKLKKSNVRFVVATDGWVLHNTSLLNEYGKLLSLGVLNRKDIVYLNQVARESSFIH